MGLWPSKTLHVRINSDSGHLGAQRGTRLCVVPDMPSVLQTPYGTFLEVPEGAVWP